ncbi:MAG: right-handed parallel beta-helix repeat-containing protein, partial [Anaerolineales bacterium]
MKAKFLFQGMARVCLMIVLLGNALTIPGQIAFAKPLTAQTDECGTIIDTHWTITGSPYVITCNASLTSGSLTIDPGVIIKFDSGARLDVYANLSAQGAESNPIIFTSNNLTPARGDWGGFYFHSGSNGSILSYAVVEYGMGISADNTSVLISHSTIRSNSSSGVYLDNSQSTVSYNTITSNTATSGAGVYVNYGVATIDSNTISWNSSSTRGGGISAYGWMGEATVTVTNNVIEHNSLGDYAGGGILFDSANGLISNNMIADNSVGNGSGGGVTIGGASGPTVTLQNNTIIRNSATTVGGGVETDGYTTITGNYIAGNTAASYGGIFYSYPGAWHGPSGIPVTCNAIVNNTGVGVYTSVLSPFHQNTIYGNSGYQFENGSANNIDAVNNYWGTTDATQIADGIYDQSDNSGLGVVSSEPFLSSSDECPPPDTGTPTPTVTATGTPTLDITSTQTETATSTPTLPSIGTFTPTSTEINALTLTPTQTVTETSIVTPSSTVTGTITPTPNPTLTPTATGTAYFNSTSTRTPTTTMRGPFTVTFTA